jgi:ribosome biogenesis protein Nip4
MLKYSSWITNAVFFYIYIYFSFFNFKTYIYIYISIGTCFGKFTKGGKFRLSITSLDYLAKFAKNKIWLKPQGE